MKTVRVCLMAVAAAFCALVLSPGITRADDFDGLDRHHLGLSARIYVRDRYDCRRLLALLPGRLADLRGLWRRMDPRRLAWALLRFRTPSPIIPCGDYTRDILQRLRFHGADLRQWRLVDGLHASTSNTIGLTDSDVTFGSIVDLH